MKSNLTSGKWNSDEIEKKKYHLMKQWKLNLKWKTLGQKNSNKDTKEKKEPEDNLLTNNICNRKVLGTRCSNCN